MCLKILIGYVVGAPASQSPTVSAPVEAESRAYAQVHGLEPDYCFFNHCHLNTAHGVLTVWKSRGCTGRSTPD